MHISKGDLFMNELNDSLDDLLSGPIANEPRVAANPNYKPLEQQFVENCPACRGTGRFVSWSGRTVGNCFKCKGAGKQTFKTSASARAAVRQQSADRKEKRAQADANAFAVANPVIYSWIEQNAPTFSFAASMMEAIKKFGSLTDGQMAACQRCIDRNEATKVAREERITNAPEVASEGIARLKASFDKAIAYSAEKGLKLSPRITIDGITISPAKAHSANPGALYVKTGSTYLGKVVDGKFFASRDCADQDKDRIVAFAANPAEAAKVYGQTTGTCCICNATLTSEWKHRGIGPICAQKFGW